MPNIENNTMSTFTIGGKTFEIEDASARSDIQIINTDLDTKADTSNVTALDTRVTAVEVEVGALANGSPTPVATVAEMTDESAVYLYTGSETGYTAGNWYYYNGTAWTSGGTYGGAVTDTTLSISGSAADAKAVGDAIDGIDSRLTTTERTIDDITQHNTTETGYDETSEIFTATTGYIYTDGSVRSTSSDAHGTWYFQASENMKVYITGLQANVGVCRMAVYEGTPLTAAGLVKFYRDGTDNPLPSSAETAIDITAGQYVAVSFYNAFAKVFTLICITEAETATLKSTLGLTAQMETEVDAKIDTAVSDGIASAIDTADEALYSINGWKTLPVSDFALGGWTSYTSTDSRAFRVRYTKTLYFGRDITILADAGFYVETFKSDGTDSGATTTIAVPANTEFKIFVRRINEDSSETADIATFANALKISTPLADIERYADTFTDLSMFPRIGICGDSYAAGGGIISGIRPLTWGKNLERQIGSIVDIYAKSGQNVVQWVTDSTNGLVALLAGEECGLYWLAHGINGTSTDELIGTPADMSANPRPATFYGQYAEAVEQIKTAFPNAKIVLQTITGTSYSLYQASQYTKVNTAIRAIAEYCEVPVIDVVDDDLYKSRWYADSMRSNHPTAMLNAGIAHANRRLFARCVMANPAYFVDFGS